MEPLLPAFRRELRARAHRLHPVVSIGHHGLTPAVLHEIGVALTAHELVKVRVLSDDRDERVAMNARICAQLDCSPVQQIGKLLVLWRPPPAEAAHPHSGKDKATKRKGNAPPLQQRREAHLPAKPPGGDVRRRRALGRSVVAPPVATDRRKTPAGKAPAGVPRAALPRRRRSAT